MAIPLIVGGVLAAAGLYKVGKAVVDNSDANDIADEARRIVRSAENNLETSRKNCQKALEELGQAKVDIITQDIQKFITVFEKIKNVDFQHDGDLGNIKLKEFSYNVLEVMKSEISMLETAGLGVGGGAIAGALTAYGAYGGTMLFASASTGTAISALSGAAATNATLAWLGGGSLAAGGLGIAGGTAALTGLVAGPALLIAGWYMGSKAEEKLNNARSNKAEAEKYRENINAAIQLTDGIQKVAKLSTDILLRLQIHLEKNLTHLKSSFNKQGLDYSQYDQATKKLVLTVVKIVQVIKAVVDTPILDKQGNLLGDAEICLSQCSELIDCGFKGEIPQSVVLDGDD